MLNHLKDNELNEKIKLLARDERALTKTIVEHIAEVDRRRLHLEMAYPSLFEYLTKEIGYSAGAAQRRLDAARLLERLPEVAEKIESGALNLSQISKVQQACRAARKEGRNIAVSAQKEILEKIENKSLDQTELIVAQEFNVNVKVEEKKRVQRDESVRLELTFSKEEMALVKRAQEILSHKTGGGGVKETILALAERTVRAAERTTRAAEGRVTAMMAVKQTPAAMAVKRSTITVTPRLRRDILNRDKCCQYKNRKTGKMCGSRHFLEVDHIQPRFTGGSNTMSNLRALCSQHNIFRYNSEKDEG